MWLWKRSLSIENSFTRLLTHNLVGLEPMTSRSFAGHLTLKFFVCLSDIFHRLSLHTDLKLSRRLQRMTSTDDFDG